MIKNMTEGQYNSAGNLVLHGIEHFILVTKVKSDNIQMFRNFILTSFLVQLITYPCKNSSNMVKHHVLFDSGSHIINMSNKPSNF